MNTLSHTLSSKSKRKNDEPSSISDDTGETAHLPERLLPHQAKDRMMIRPTVAQKACVERIAEQMEMKRSHLDGTFYLTGALLLGVERSNTSEPIGTWSRKEVASYLKPMFTSLFELLYEQDELPLAFALLIQSTIGSAQIAQHDQEQSPFFAMSRKEKQDPVLPAEADRQPFFSVDVEVDLDGFPECI
jgi:hypothetical protein